MNVVPGARGRNGEVDPDLAIDPRESVDDIDDQWLVLGPETGVNTHGSADEGGNAQRAPDARSPP